VLTLLKISGFALIDEAEIAFGPGLTVVTGETGAGKSILVEALGLLRGGRAGADVIRTGRDEARVEAIIELPQASAARAQLLADGRDDDDGLVVRRTIARAGRGRAHLGGSLATASDLGALVRPLIDIASQHDQQSLTDPESQLAMRVLGTGSVCVAIAWTAGRRLFLQVNTVSYFAERTIFLGHGPLIKPLIEDIKARPELGLAPIGIVSDGDITAGVPVVGDPSQLLDIVVSKKIDRVVIDMTERRGKLRS